MESSQTYVNKCYESVVGLFNNEPETPTTLPVLNLHWMIQCSIVRTNLVFCFAWLLFLAIGIYCVSYGHLGRFLFFLRSFRIIEEVFINCMTLSFRPTVFVIGFLRYLALSSIRSHCGDVENGIRPPQFCTVILWCHVEVDQLGEIVII